MHRRLDPPGRVRARIVASDDPPARLELPNAPRILTASGVSNSPNTVAPEPDMRARRQPRCWPTQRHGLADRGRRRWPAPRGRCRPERESIRLPGLLARPTRRGSIASGGERPGCRAERAKDRGGGCGDAGIDEHAGSAAGPRASESVSPMPRSCGAGADRGRRARRRRSPRRRPRTRVMLKASWLAGKSRSAAAASDEPPPMPAAAGRRLTRRKCP